MSPSSLIWTLLEPTDKRPSERPPANRSAGAPKLRLDREPLVAPGRAPVDAKRRIRVSANRSRLRRLRRSCRSSCAALTMRTNPPRISSAPSGADSAGRFLVAIADEMALPEANGCESRSTRMVGRRNRGAGELEIARTKRQQRKTHAGRGRRQYRRVVLTANLDVDHMKRRDGQKT